MGLQDKRLRKIQEAGDFQAWIVAVGMQGPAPDHLPGYSAHAWEIRPKREKQTVDAIMNLPEAQSDGDAKPSDGPDSNQNRGHATGAYRVAEALPDNSFVHIVSPSTYIVGAINEWLPVWRGNGFLKADGKPVEHGDWWKMFDEECSRRNIKASAEHLKTGNYDGNIFCKRLKITAQRVRDAQIPRRPGR